MQRLLVAGFGDIARRAMPQLERRFAVVPLGRRSGFDLDRPASLEAAHADAVLHCAPPAEQGDTDQRTANLLVALEKGGILPSRIFYVSTSGVHRRLAGAPADYSPSL